MTPTPFQKPDAPKPSADLGTLPSDTRDARLIAKPVALQTERGFLLPALLRADAALHRRWDYWQECQERGRLPDAPIPRIDFLSTPDTGVWKMLTAALDTIPEQRGVGWQGWSSTTYFRYFLEWMLHGLHHAGQPERPDEPTGGKGAHERLRQTVDLAVWQQAPYDYLGDLLAQNAYGKKQGFFPTPHPIAELMRQITLPSGVDWRTQTVCDPCVGTGRLLLHTSNHSLRLYGMELDALLCQATLVNGFLFAPWLVKPLPFLDEMQYQPKHSAILSDAMAAQAPPHQQKRLHDTEHDAETQWQFEPIKKRRPKGAGDAISQVRQGRLL